MYMYMCVGCPMKYIYIHIYIIHPESLNACAMRVASTRSFAYAL